VPLRRAHGPRDRTGGLATGYVLRSVAGDALPAALVVNDHVTIVALADTVWLRPDGTGLQVVVHRVADAGAPQSAEYRFEQPFTYQQTGERIAISLDCIDVIIRSCVPPPHYQGTLSESSLTLDAALFYRTPLLYHRLRSST